MSGFLLFADKRRRRERATDLSVAALGARGSAKDLKKTMTDWSKE